MKENPKYISAQEVDQYSNVLELSEVFRERYLQNPNDIEVPQRTSIIRHDPFKAFDIMPAYSEKSKLFITKIGSVIPKENSEVSLNTTLVAFSGETGKILAIFDGDSITKLKCAAVTAMVTDCCADPESKILGLIGSGVQAKEQVHGVLAVRDIDQIRVFSRNKKNVIKFIEEQKKTYNHIDFVVCESAEETTMGADIVSTATTSFKPIIKAEALQCDKLHINCIGNHIEETREIPQEILQNSFVTVEDKQTAILEAGKIHEKATTLQDLVTLEKDTLYNTRTVFSSTGHAFLDLITVAYLMERIHN